LARHFSENRFRPSGQAQEHPFRDYALVYRIADPRTVEHATRDQL
jgi:hypothetical protein